MLKGTQVLIGTDAEKYRNIINRLTETLRTYTDIEVILPSIWEAATFNEKITGDTFNQMWRFRDKAEREVCLVPEATGMVQAMYNAHWSKSMTKPIPLYYITKCFRYEKPQLGRLREFTQVGMEVLSDNITEADILEVKKALRECLDNVGLRNYTFNDSVKRGLGYYIEDGFEVECSSLGAQKQIAGGGKYAEGIGWAIGVERLLLALDGEASSVG